MRTDWHLQQLANGDVHLTPNNDQVDHTLDPDCICHPSCEAVFRDDGSNGWLYAHHSLDGREHHEPDHNQDNCPLCTRNFDLFHAASVNVPPHEWVAQRARKLHSEGVAILVVTARSHKWRHHTAWWLALNNIPSDGLWMRTDGDHRPDIGRGSLS